MAINSVRRPVKSTNVRFKVLKGALHAAAAMSPQLAGKLSEQLMLTPPRHQRPEWEREVLLDARRFNVEHPDGAMAAWSWGVGPTVLLVHGWAGRGSQLGAFVDPLVRNGFRVVAFDGPGHGDTRSKRSSVYAQAKAVHGMAEALGGVFAVVAHSFGGAAAALAHGMLKAPIERFVLIAPPLTPVRYAHGFVETMGLSPAVEAEIGACFEARNHVKMEELDVRRHAAKLLAPALLIHDQGDTEVPHADGEEMARVWEGAQFVSTTGLGHRRILRSPQIVERALHFLAPGAVLPSEEIEQLLMHREQRSA